MFRIYYGDGTTYEGAPEDAPAENVQCIAWDDTTPEPANVGRIVMYNWDIYLYSDQIGWHGTNKYADLLYHLKRRCGPGGVRAVLQGAWIDRKAFDQILKRAETDPPLKPKSARNSVIEDGTE